MGFGVPSNRYLNERFICLLFLRIMPPYDKEVVNIIVSHKKFNMCKKVGVWLIAITVVIYLTPMFFQEQ